MDGFIGFEAATGAVLDRAESKQMPTDDSPSRQRFSRVCSSPEARSLEAPWYGSAHTQLLPPHLPPVRVASFNTAPDLGKHAATALFVRASRIESDIHRPDPPATVNRRPSRRDRQG